MLEELGIQTDGIIKSPYRVTTSKRRVMAKAHQMLRIDSEDYVSLCGWEFCRLTQKIDACMKPRSTVLISDYAKGCVSAELITYIIARARERDCLVMVDPKGPRFDKYKNVDYIKPNFKEYSQMIEFFGLDKKESMVNNARRLCSILSIKAMIITLGEKGILLVTPTEHIESPSVRREVFDITGAGDTAFAFLALGFAHNRTPTECLGLANAAAAVAISHIKTYAVSLDELLNPIEETTNKIYLDWAKLKIELDWLRVEGKKIVFTNGCFDILHPGHIHTLNEAKRFGDVLVVALNTDESIKRLKGPSRPIYELADRMMVMAALGVVDFVVPFGQDTPAALLEYVRPDVLVKGGDYKAHEIVGYDFVTSYGGSVQIVDFVQGKSTTGTVARMKEMAS
jgi:D-beta-D-heptose 7-phosphate kinase/D-beta-D-heptose 1-phosphate adenosyltransferase